MSDMLNLNQVRAFVAVIDSGGFAEAARRLDCAQPTVTQLVQRLEAALGAQLIIRGRIRCVPSPHGEIFLPHARGLVRAEQQAAESVRAKSLRIGASGNIGTYLLPTYLKHFRERVETKFDLLIGTNPETAEKMKRGEIDLAVVEWWNHIPGFAARIWRRERLVVIVPPTHAWAHQKRIPKKWLLEVAMIGGEAGTGTGRLLQGILGENARVSMQLGSTAAVKEAVKAGLGISLVFLSSVAEELRTGSLCALELEGKPVDKELVIVAPEGIPPTAASSRFINFLEAEAA